MQLLLFETLGVYLVNVIFHNDGGKSIWSNPDLESETGSSFIVFRTTYGDYLIATMAFVKKISVLEAASQLAA